MKISANGLLKRAAAELKQYEAKYQKGACGHSFCLTELLKHLKELGREYKKGNKEIVNEFLNLYCLTDDKDLLG